MPEGLKALPGAYSVSVCMGLKVCCLMQEQNALKSQGPVTLRGQHQHDKDYTLQLYADSPGYVSFAFVDQIEKSIPI